jgi:hypothetical protein
MIDLVENIETNIDTIANPEEGEQNNETEEEMGSENLSTVPKLKGQ